MVASELGSEAIDPRIIGKETHSQTWIHARCA